VTGALNIHYLSRRRPTSDILMLV